MYDWLIRSGSVQHFVRDLCGNDFQLFFIAGVAQNNTTATTNVTMTPTVMTTRMPTEIPNPVYEKGTFTLNDTDNKPCIVATMAAMLTVTYKKTDNVSEYVCDMQSRACRRRFVCLRVCTS